MYSVEKLDKEMMHILGDKEQHGVRVHCPTQNGELFKTYKLFTSGIFHFWTAVDCRQLKPWEVKLWMEGRGIQHCAKLCSRVHSGKGRSFRASIRFSKNVPGSEAGKPLGETVAESQCSPKSGHDVSVSLKSDVSMPVPLSTSIFQT